MRCLVTGASGHLGAFLTRRLRAAGAEIAILVRPQSDLWRLGAEKDKITVLQGDLSDLSAVQAQVTQFAPEIIFHLAWQGVTGEDRNSPMQITRNVAGSLKLLDIAREAGCLCWVGVGSQAEYGAHSGILNEETPARPETAYGVAKYCTGLLSEKFCAEAGIRFLWVRLLAAYGPMDDARHLIPSVITELLAGRVPALTTGEQRWDYLYIDDAVEAIVRLALNANAQGVFNLGSGEAPTIRSVVERIRSQIAPALSLGFGALPYRRDQVMHLQADTAKLQAATGWHPKISLDEGLKRTVQWHQAHNDDMKRKEEAR